MESILDWGLGVVIWLQRFHPWLDSPFKVITFLGNEGFFLAFLPFLYWCVDRREGARLTVLFLLSAYLNTAFKTLADQPRPFQYDSRVVPLVRAGGGGFPSGHTQGAVVVWGYLALRFRRPLTWVAAGFLMVLIPLSRLYLGVHFPMDLIGGYVIGGLLLGLYLWLAPAVEAWLKGQGASRQLGLAVAGPLILVPLLPSGAQYGIGAAATLWGMGVGFVLERRWVRFGTDGPWFKKILRFTLGAAVLIALWAGLKSLFAPFGADPLFRFVRYGLVGLWGGVGAPWVFVRLGLAGKETEH